MQRGEGPNDVKGASLWGGGGGGGRVGGISCLRLHSHTLNLQKHFVLNGILYFPFM